MVPVEGKETATDLERRQSEGGRRGEMRMQAYESVEREGVWD